MRALLTFLLITVLAPVSGARTLLVEDKLGREVAVEVPVERAIFLSLYEFIPALDLWDRVVGINRWAFQNTLVQRFRQMERIPPVGTGAEVNMEAVMALRPDLVITWIYKPQVVEFMERRGLKVIAVYPESLDELYQDVRLCGRLFAEEARAERVLSLMDELFEVVRSGVSGIPAGKRRKVLWLWGTPTRVNGGIGVQHDVIELIGGVNCAGGIRLKSVEVSLERIVAWDPDVIFIWGSAKYSPEDLLESSQWASVKAVREGRVYKAPSWSTWSPRLALIALWMAERTYPEVFGGVPVRRITDRFYREVYGIPFEEEFH